MSAPHYGTSRSTESDQHTVCPKVLYTMVGMRAAIQLPASFAPR